LDETGHALLGALQIIFLFFGKKIICERHLSRSSGSDFHRYQYGWSKTVSHNEPRKPSARRGLNLFCGCMQNLFCPRCSETNVG